MQGVMRKGYVKRIRDNSDRRSAYAQLTPKGWEFLRRVAPHHVASVRRRFVDRLSKAEMAAMATAFEKLGPLR
jgi:DNA-binding MarR family transcriptional regulator